MERGTIFLPRYVKNKTSYERLLFIMIGMNSILVYVGSELLEGMFPFGWKGMELSHIEFLISNVISVSLWCLVAYYWYIIKFFVKI